MGLPSSEGTGHEEHIVSIDPLISHPSESTVRLQYGALPYRITSAGDFEFLMVTSRRTRRWIIPKGWPMKRTKPAVAAAREAYEEAGVLGTVSADSIGAFIYEKFLDEKRGSLTCAVRVFPLMVIKQLSTWPESHQRKIRWFTSEEFDHSQDNEGLRELVDLFATGRRHHS